MTRATTITAAGAQSRGSDGAATGRWSRVLSPVERLSEILFGLIMALSITGAMSVAEGDAELRPMLAAALGCNTAWGIVDALMYLMATLAERYRGVSLLAALRREQEPERAHRVIADTLPPLVAASMLPSHVEQLRRQLVGMEELPRAGITYRDLLGALGVFLLVFVSTLPVIVPFLLPVTPREALRLSNGVALTMLFALGYALGRHVSYRPIAMGAAMVAVGASLVGIVMALGG